MTDPTPSAWPPSPPPPGVSSPPPALAPPPPFAEAGTVAAPATASTAFEGVPQVDRDQEHLKVLSICWYVASGLAILFGMFPLIYVVIGIVMVNGGMGGGPSPPPPQIGWILILVGSAVSLLAWTGSALGFVTAHSLPRRRRIGFCYAAAGLACLQIPIGTCLGVFTFVLLGRPSVRASFAAK